MVVLYNCKELDEEQYGNNVGNYRNFLALAGEQLDYSIADFPWAD